MSDLPGESIAGKPRVFRLLEWFGIGSIRSGAPDHLLEKRGARLDRATMGRAGAGAYAQGGTGERAGYTKAHDSRKGSVAQQVRYRGPHNARAEAEGNGDVRE